MKPWDTERPEVLTEARRLLGRTFALHGVTVRLTEVEAYAGTTDPASHAFTRTPRSEIMYGPPGRLYVYRLHGHHCANIVTGPRETASAVLLRAGEVVDGRELAQARRGEVPDHRLASGPGNFARALGITMDDLGAEVEELISTEATVSTVSCGPRVGVRLAADRPWRFWLDGEPSVSAYRRHRLAGQ